MGQIKFFTALILTSLFALAIVGFAIDFGENNDASVLLSEDPEFSGLRPNLNNTVGTLQNNVNSSSNAFFSSSIGDATVTETGGQFKVGIGTVMSMVGYVITSGFEKIFGQNNGFGVFLTVLTALLLYIGIMYAYKAWVGRNPD